MNEACPARGTIRRVPTVTVYGRPGCHLCDDALAVLERIRRDAPFALETSTSRATTPCCAPTSSASRWWRSTATSCTTTSWTRPICAARLARVIAAMSLGDVTPSVAAGAGNGAGGWRAPLARRRRAPVALPAGPHAGQEDGQGDDLVPGARDYTHVNSTQIRRDLSGFGKFGKRGVGYNVDSLVSQIRKILRTAGQHNIALFGAGHLGQAIASSDIFADHGFRVVAIFDNDPAKVGEPGRRASSVRPVRRPRQVVEEEDIVVGVLAVPTAAAQALADDLVEAGVKIIFNYSEALLQVPPEVTVHTSSPAVDLLYALYFYLT